MGPPGRFLPNILNSMHLLERMVAQNNYHKSSPLPTQIEARLGSARRSAARLGSVAKWMAQHRLGEEVCAEVLSRRNANASVTTPLTAELFSVRCPQEAPGVS